MTAALRGVALAALLTAAAGYLVAAIANEPTAKVIQRAGEYINAHGTLTAAIVAVDGMLCERPSHGRLPIAGETVVCRWKE